MHLPYAAEQRGVWSRIWGKKFEVLNELINNNNNNININNNNININDNNNNNINIT